MTDATYGGDTGSRPGGRTADDMKSTAMEKADKAKTAVKDQASQLASQAKDKAAGEVERRKGEATQTLDDFAEAIRRAAGALSEQDHSMGARFAQQAAEGLADISRTLSNKSPEDMLRSAREFGRSNPTAFFAASVLAGIALGRVAGSSSQPDTPSQSATGGQLGQGAQTSLGQTTTGQSAGQAAGGSSGATLESSTPSYGAAGGATVTPGLGASGVGSGIDDGRTSR